MGNKVVITGMGAISPIGLSVEESFKAAAEGKCGIVRATGFDTEATQIYVAGEVGDFDPTPYISKREARRMARFSQFAFAAAIQAWQHSGMENSVYDAERIGLILGSGMGGLDVICEQHKEMLEAGPRAVSSLFIPKAIINTAAGTIAIRLGLHGPCYGIVTACSSGADALGQAYYAVKEGRLDGVLVGGAESCMTELAVMGFHQMQALSESKDPSRASIPFDKDRNGFVMGEGAAFMMIESLEHANKRNAEILAEFAGYAQTCDAYHITAPEPTGTYAAKAMRMAMIEAGVSPEEVGYINSHGTSTPLNDAFESLAIEKCFGEHSKKLLVNSTKSMTGHMLGAAGAFEALITVCSLREGVCPPTIGLLNEGEGCNLDYVKGTKRAMDTGCGLSNSFGFGGHNSSVVIKKI